MKTIFAHGLPQFSARRRRHLSRRAVVPCPLVRHRAGLLEIRVMCSHCPHYAEAGSSLQCWANYGSPKLWKYRPGPMSRVERALFLGGLGAVWGYPLIFLLAGTQWFLLAVYALTSAGFFATLKTYLCSQCMNFACPLNSVQDETRQAFFERNPRIAEAWGVVSRD